MRALEGEQVGVDAGDDHRDPLGVPQIAEDLGDPARARGVEGEDVPARSGQFREPVQPAGGVVLAGGGEAAVVHAFELDLAGPFQRDAVGVVAQFDGCAVHVADRQRIAVREPVALSLGEGGEEPAQSLGRRPRVRQPVAGYAALLPRGERRLERGGVALMA